MTTDKKLRWFEKTLTKITRTISKIARFSKAAYGSQIAFFGVVVDVQKDGKGIVIQKIVVDDHVKMDDDSHLDIVKKAMVRAATMAALSFSSDVGIDEKLLRDYVGHEFFDAHFISEEESGGPTIGVIDFGESENLN